MGFSLGGAISGLFGSDKQASFHMDPVQTNPNAYQYGGWAGGAHEAADRYNQQGLAAQGRQGVQFGTGQIDQSRAQQQNALGMAQAAAEGRAPSAAAIQQKQGLDSAMGSQLAMAAGARGPAAIATAQYGAAQNAVGLQQHAVNDAASLRANEMAGARQDYASQAAGMRGADFQQAAGQAQLDAQQRAQNDQYQLGMTGFEYGVNNSQLQAQGQQQAQQSQNDLGAQTLNLKAQQGADQENSSNSQFGIGTIAGAAMSDARAKMGVQPEGGGALGYGMPAGVGVDRAPMGMGDAQGGAGGIGPYLGLMSMNQEALGYGPGAIKPPSPTSPTAEIGSQKKVEQKKLGDILGAGDSGSDPYSRGMSAGKSIRSGFGSLFGGENKGDTTGLAGAMGGGTGAAASGTAALSDAHAKEAARAEGVREGMSAVSALFTPNMQPVARGHQDPASQMQTNAQPAHAQAPQHAAPAQMLEQLHPVSYNYKPGVGEDPSKRQYGILAQDLAASPMGASVVEQRPDGLLAVDVPKATTANMAASANLHQRLRELEHREALRSHGQSLRSAIGGMFAAPQGAPAPQAQPDVAFGRGRR